jgi:1,4-dihydroxy-2-naphthoyl-CoA hydrolase
VDASTSAGPAASDPAASDPAASDPVPSGPAASGSDPLARLRDGATLTLEDLAEVLPSRDAFGGEAVGIRWDTFALDRVTAHVELDERHHQPFGLVHGGVWCTIVESLASVAGSLRAAVTGDVVVGVANATDFLRAHRTGRVDAVATPVHVGRTQQLWQVAITRADDGKPVARGQVRLQQLPGDRQLAGRPAGEHASAPAGDGSSPEADDGRPPR